MAHNYLRKLLTHATPAKMVPTILLLCLLSTLAQCQDKSSPMSDVNYPDEKVEKELEKKSVTMHKLDTLTLMIYVLLMMLTVFVAWGMKHMHVKWLPVHETGFTLTLGAIVGLLILLVMRYNESSVNPSSLQVQAVNESMLALLHGVPPDYTQLTMGIKNASYNYRLQDGFNTEAKSMNLLEEEASFSPEVFFNILLPPIIFNAGYGMKKKQFFRNIGSIMALAFLGTTISCFFVGVWDCPPVTILAIFSDLGVEQDLYALVFGESVLNDAVAIVLASTIELYIGASAGHSGATGVSFLNILSAFLNFFVVFGGSFAIGALVGCLCAMFTKFTDMHRYPMLETSLFLLMSYLSFLVAEVAGLTGIVAVLFCGMCQAHYTYNNLSEESQHRTKQFFEALNFLSENFIFTYIGVSLFTSHSSQFNFWFALVALVSVVLARCLHVYGLSFLLNLKRKPKIPFSHQHMLVFAGLRGAIAYALALRNTSTVQRKFIYTATSLIVAVTVLINGGFTQFAIEKLGIRCGAHSEQETHQLEGTKHSSPNPYRAKVRSRATVNESRSRPAGPLIILGIRPFCPGSGTISMQHSGNMDYVDLHAPDGENNRLDSDDDYTDLYVTDLESVCTYGRANGSAAPAVRPAFV